MINYMGRSTVHYADNKTNNILKALHNKLRPAGTPVQRVEYIIELLLLRIFEVKLKQDKEFAPLRKLFEGDNYRLLFSHLLSLSGKQALDELNKNIFPFYGNILTKAREVFKKNLPQKVQDQLVLIEGVFANSSFTNNVKTGNLSEIISLVDEIDERRILETDLLGDAIESALSEQGGTKDVGLYRTPDHIRQMMVVMADPGFQDTIFDPACGTGGFLFDSFQYVLEKVSKDGKWPGEKAHKEVKKYIDAYLKKVEAKMPSTALANMFYRVGIGGIEYLGMIRKMAAINLYIRGLNPQNIEQGDSLDMFEPGVDAGTKSVVIANPPFGAKLDQDAYPNVWEEYPKTDSTTLFVKLMFNYLKKGGRCAVVVSEGFLTWDNEPAREMRKLLLEECNLRAIISLPQGVFVSKNGQGAKTSILYFEKREPTKQIWYYKITNDGYSSGVNRKEIPGSQIPEVLELFTKYVREDKTPLPTKNSFVIPAEWIKEIDPRLKERIIAKTVNQQKEKFSQKREQEIKKLKERLEKGKITKKQYKEKVWQFDNMVENAIQNEIAKRLEKAHSYSFNLQNYRSGLRQEQIEKWRKAFKGVKAKNNSSIEDRYQVLKKADTKTAWQILASFNPESALEMDIAREYLSKARKKDKKLKELEDILKESFKYPFVPLRDLLILNKNKIKPSKYPDKDFIILGVSNTEGVFINEKKKGSEIKQSYYEVAKNQFCYNPYRVNVGSIGLNDFDNGNTQIISGAYNVFGVNENEINPKYLMALFKTKKFNDYVNEQATGGVRMNFKFEYLQNWQIPLPPLEVQQEIVEKIERQKAIIDGAEKIEKNWRLDLRGQVFGSSKFTLGDLLSLEYGKNLPESKRTGKGYLVYGSNGIVGYHSEYLIKGPGIIIGRKGSIGEVNWSVNDFWPIDTTYFVKLKKKNLNLRFIYYLLKSLQLNTLNNSPAIPGLNRNEVYLISVNIPTIDIQLKIVAQLDKEMEALEKVRELKAQAQKRIEKILDEVWGE